MDLAKYQELTGITISAQNETFVTAQISRAQSTLETMLGFTLCPDNVEDNLYDELGKTQQSCLCPSDIDIANLEDADDVEGAYRLYRYNPNDKYFHVDPFSIVYKVKLVHILPGEEQGVTIKTFDDEDLRVHYGRGDWSKFIEHCKECLCFCDCKDCIQLAVDADWLWTDCPPTDLLYVWADMVTYQVDCKKDIKSESIQGHSYTKFDRVLPETVPQNYAIIQRYAGPHGSATRELTV